MPYFFQKDKYIFFPPLKRTANTWQLACCSSLHWQNLQIYKSCFGHAAQTHPENDPSLHLISLEEHRARFQLAGHPGHSVLQADNGRLSFGELGHQFAVAVVCCVAALYGSHGVIHRHRRLLLLEARRGLLRHGGETSRLLLFLHKDHIWLAVSLLYFLKYKEQLLTACMTLYW